MCVLLPAEQQMNTAIRNGLDESIGDKLINRTGKETILSFSCVKISRLLKRSGVAFD